MLSRYIIFLAYILFAATHQKGSAMLPLYLLTLAVLVRVQSHHLLPGSCNFESSTCGYTSDPELTSWTLNDDGRFVSLESSRAKEGGDNRGVLQSPRLEQEDWNCLTLVYQITETGFLQVQRRQEGKSFDTPMWSSQSPSDSWVVATMDLQNTQDPYRLVIEGRPGERPGSGVAVFQIHISPGYCLECDFEQSHLCGYSNQWNTNVNWYVGGGMSHAPRGNLPVDHTYNNRTGHYMYVDSTYAKTFKEVAKLMSPMIRVPVSGCLSFQYQRGEERGYLFSIFTRDQMGQYQELWKAAPPGENQTVWTAVVPGQWIPVQVDLKAPYPLQVVFEVAFNSPRGGHVAIDDISFSPEFCSEDTEPTFDPSIASCDFESGFCRYSQDSKAGSATWKRLSLKPNIFRSGDHTTGAGSFLLAHSRLSPPSGYVSRLTGPVLAGNMKYCLRFYFSLSGFNQTGRALSVYLQYLQSNKQEKIWTQGEKSTGIWFGGDVTFQTSQPAMVVFVSTCVSFWDCGSVALDDIRVSLGDCEMTQGLQLSVPGHCDFEAGLCGYTQDKTSDAGDWERRRGQTPTSYTGPRGDHTTGRGYYMHIEASSMVSGQSARLLSQPLRGSRGSQCLSFYFHMYGSGTGRLRVLMHRGAGEDDVLLWQRGGEQSITWLRAAVEYQTDQQHQIVFDATRGSSVRSDIAIDDIIFESGPCPESESRAPLSSAVSNEIE